MKNNKVNSSENILKQEVSGIKAKRVNKVKDARRLLAKLIFDFQLGKLSPEYLKTLCYALIKYSELFKVETLENIDVRIKIMEDKINAKNN